PQYGATKLFLGVKCGFEDNADVVGAINILARGMEIWREKGGTRPDGLWIELGWRLEAGTPLRFSGTEFLATQKRQHTALERRRHPQPSGRGGCQQGW
ncbi:MAG: hypothetical protein Q6K81_05715, partial [Gloeomargarita sp. DG02_5_bins_242]